MDDASVTQHLAPQLLKSIEWQLERVGQTHALLCVPKHTREQHWRLFDHHSSDQLQSFMPFMASARRLWVSVTICNSPKTEDTARHVSLYNVPTPASCCQQVLSVDRAQQQRTLPAAATQGTAQPRTIVSALDQDLNMLTPQEMA